MLGNRYEVGEEGVYLSDAIPLGCDVCSACTERKNTWRVGFAWRGNARLSKTEEP
jgi:hypothetical protein